MPPLLNTIAETVEIPPHAFAGGTDSGVTWLIRGSLQLPKTWNTGGPSHKEQVAISGEASDQE